ncbi:MAG: phytoene desaturase family protein [Motilibacteraceae bacterium]
MAVPTPAGLRDADVVVIGSGSGGLSAATHLAVAGRRVLVVEARDVADGHLTALQRGGYSFDVGLQFTVAREAQHLLAPLGLDIAFRDYDPAMNFRVVLPGADVAAPRGLPGFREQLLLAFPGERDTVEAFLRTVRELEAAMRGLQQHPGVLGLPALPWRARSLLRHARSTLGGYLDALHASPQLKAVLGLHVVTMGTEPARLSLVAYAVVLSHYLQGASYPEGGAQRIADGLVHELHRHGGAVLTGHEVTQILVSGKQVRGVRVSPTGYDSASETSFDVLAPVVVAAGDLRRTVLELVPDGALPERVVRRVRSAELPLPVAGMFLVLDRDLRAEGVPVAGQHVLEDPDVDRAFAALRHGQQPPAMSLTLCPTSLVDPTDAALCAPGQTNLQLLTISSPSHRYWGVEPGAAAGARYAARKRELRGRLLGLADRLVPGIEDSLAFEETFTPLVEERWMRVSGGQSYGLAFTPSQLMSRPGPKTSLRGLFLAGAATRTGHGLVGTLAGGAAAAAAVLGIPEHELLARRPQRALASA